MFTYLRFSYRIFVASLVLILSLINSASPLQSQQVVELSFDDGTFEQFVGFDDGQGVLANGPFVPPSFPATITEVRFQTDGAFVDSLSRRRDLRFRRQNNGSSFAESDE